MLTYVCNEHPVDSIKYREKWGLQRYKPGPSCSKLAMSLVNVSLKFQSLISYIFFVEKCEKLLQYIAKASHIFSTKNISLIGYEVLKLFTS